MRQPLPQLRKNFLAESVTAEVAGSKPVVSAILSKRGPLIPAKPARTQKGTFWCPSWCPIFRPVLCSARIFEFMVGSLKRFDSDMATSGGFNFTGSALFYHEA
jgi:hypothetical protein